MVARRRACRSVIVRSSVVGGVRRPGATPVIPGSSGGILDRGRKTVAVNALPRPRSLYAVIEALPEGYTGEIVAGQLYVQPRPAARHIRLASRLGSKLETPFDEGDGGPGGWWILDEPEVHFVLDAEVAVPDIAGWRRERMPELPDGHRFETPPDWLCEVASPSSAVLDRGDKMRTYGRFGVRHVWLVDPLARTVEAFVNEDGEGGWHEAGTARGDEAVCLPPFEAVSFRLPWS